MVEYVRIGYTRLFEVRLLHHFWLDEGATVFDAIADPELRNRRLLAYDVRRMLAVEPSSATATTLAGLRGFYRTSGLGYFVAVPSDAVLPLDTGFEFFVTVTDSAYSNYTSLSLRPQPITDVPDPADPRIIHRYKANVPVLGNTAGAVRGTGAAKRLFLSQEYATGSGDGVEALVTSGSGLHQLTGDPPGAPVHALGPTNVHPVYVHQGDVPAITPPPGSTGAAARGIELVPDTPPMVAAIVRLVPRRADDNDFSFVEADGSPRASARVFEVHFRNRWTTWRYRDKRDGAVASVEAAPLPLTYFGNAGVKQKPSPEAIDIEFDNGSPPKITRLFSDVYV
ncbi:hypothetical protein [Arthrobacter sp. H20]|uniref:hypothetical protein n=1 Tax=Arthrobacter sp. H20 TaxID=1267981 RepID=UPI00047D266A|nr:hypothetical protein [Arthrobacter sp. H20]